LNRKRIGGVLAFALLLLGGVGASAQSRLEEDFDDKDKVWQEIEIQLPAPPAAADLLPFYVSATATQSFAIDARSLAVGSDGVVRYTLVARSPAGATSISYEGIRCESFEKKVYAFGRSDGSWSRSRRDQWERIISNAANRQHASLAREYFCQEKMVAGKAVEIVERIRSERPLSPRG
jgi:hypothetical protein